MDVWMLLGDVRGMMVKPHGDRKDWLNYGRPAFRQYSCDTGCSCGLVEPDSITRILCIAGRDNDEGSSQYGRIPTSMSAAMESTRCCDRTVPVRWIDLRLSGA